MLFYNEFLIIVQSNYVPADAAIHNRQVYFIIRFKLYKNSFIFIKKLQIFKFYFFFVNLENN